MMRHRSRCRTNAAQHSVAARSTFRAHEAGKNTAPVKPPKETSMSFVTTQPEALAYAAGKLQTIGSGVAAESAAAAAPTTNVIPAAADEVSALQAAIFGAYGSLYQSVNAQAASVHELLVHTLGASAARLRPPSPSNSATTASPLAERISSFLGSAASTDPPGGSLANIANIGTGNWGFRFFGSAGDVWRRSSSRR